MVTLTSSTFTDRLRSEQAALEILINNAAQTVRRTPENPAGADALERMDLDAFPANLVPILVNVAGLDGQFGRGTKTDRHPHVKMSKAALKVVVRTWIADYGSGLCELPDRLFRSVRLLWRGMIVPPEVVFCPETLTSERILGERNAELHRVMLDRVGLDDLLRRS